MNYKVIINPELGGNELGNKYNNEYDKDYILRFSKLLSNKLNEYNIDNILVRTDDRYLSSNDRNNIINTINNESNYPLILTIGLGNNLIDIIYSINNNDKLAKLINDNLTDDGFIVNKYYQQRDSINTNKDFENIIKDNPNNESIIVRLGNLSTNNNYLNGNIDGLVNSLVKSLTSYLNVSNDTYIVKKGDNLYSIAKKYNTTVEELKKINNLNSNLLSINQQLKIPSGNYYIVKNGDTLFMGNSEYSRNLQNL